MARKLADGVDRQKGPGMNIDTDRSERIRRRQAAKKLTKGCPRGRVDARTRCEAPARTECHSYLANDYAGSGTRRTNILRAEWSLFGHSHPWWDTLGSRYTGARSGRWHLLSISRHVRPGRRGMHFLVPTKHSLQTPRNGPSSPRPIAQAGRRSSTWSISAVRGDNTVEGGRRAREGLFLGALRKARLLNGRRVQLRRWARRLGAAWTRGGIRCAGFGAGCSGRAATARGAVMGQPQLSAWADYTRSGTRSMRQRRARDCPPRGSRHSRSGERCG